MKFSIMESEYLNQGTEKAFADSDCYGNRYFIPRSQVKVIERIEPTSEYGVAHIIIDVPNWIINKNSIPIFKMTSMKIYR